MATSAGATRAADRITFAHNSERQFARLLDFYRVEWEYEPTAFPIEWDAAGRPVRHFRPDFHLPGFGLYIEITTLNQRLVTKKNRKVRRLRELYPDVRIKVLYQRDYLSLLAKYGLEPPSQMVDPPTASSPTGTATPGASGSGGGGPTGDRPAAGPVRPPSTSAGAPARRPPEAGGAVSRARPGGPSQARAPGRGKAPETATPEAPRSGGGGPTGHGPTGGSSRPSSTGSARPPAPAGGAVGRARAAGRPRVVPDPPGPVPPLPADPELVRLAEVLLPAELADRRGPAAAERAG